MTVLSSTLLTSHPRVELKNIREMTLCIMCECIQFRHRIFISHFIVSSYLSECWNGSELLIVGNFL